MEHQSPHSPVSRKPAFTNRHSMWAAPADAMPADGSAMLESEKPRRNHETDAEVCLRDGRRHQLARQGHHRRLDRRILKSRGIPVCILKLDPYINIDPGTMSPYQHGEVFVTDDGAETDLDLGHYERFIDENLSQARNVTTGRIYQA